MVGRLETSALETCHYYHVFLIPVVNFRSELWLRVWPGLLPGEHTAEGVWRDLAAGSERPWWLQCLHFCVWTGKQPWCQTMRCRENSKPSHTRCIVYTTHQFLCSLIQTLTLTPPPKNALLANMDMCWLTSEHLPDSSQHLINLVSV